MHAAPADLTLCGEPLAVIFGYRACFLEGLRNPLCIPGRILRPLPRRCSGVNPNDAVFPNSELAELRCNPARFLDLNEKPATLRFISHGRSPTRVRPHW